jgi:hypothetical protein
MVVADLASKLDDGELLRGDPARRDQVRELNANPPPNAASIYVWRHPPALWWLPLYSVLLAVATARETQPIAPLL